MERVQHFTGPKGHQELMISWHNHASEENTPQLQRWTVPMESRALQIMEAQGPLNAGNQTNCHIDCKVIRAARFHGLNYNIDRI